MNSRILFSAVAVAALSLLAACGGGDASEDSAANRAAPASVVDTGGIGGSGILAHTTSVGTTATPAVGGIGGSGTPQPLVGGIGGSGIESVGLSRSCGLANVEVTIAGARVNADGAAGPGDPGWIDVAPAAPVRADLLRLAAGEALPLDLSALPDGTYRQIRLLLVANDAAAPRADAVIGADGQVRALDVRALQGGLRLASTITVAQGRPVEATVALDVCQAVSGTGDTLALGGGSTSRVATTY